jgi:hypothetical protein
MPEQVGIASVWGHVIGDGRDRGPALGETHAAQRLYGELMLPEPTPSRRVVGVLGSILVSKLACGGRTQGMGTVKSLC